MYKKKLTINQQFNNISYNISKRCVCVKNMTTEKTLADYFDDPQFMHSTSNGRTLRMDCLKFIVRGKSNSKTWIEIKSDVEKIIRMRFPSLGFKVKNDYLEELHDYYDTVNITRVIKY